MRKYIAGSLLLVLAGLPFACSSDDDPTSPAPVTVIVMVTATITMTPTITLTPTVTPTPTVTNTGTPTATPTRTRTPLFEQFNGPSLNAALTWVDTAGGSSYTLDGYMNWTVPTDRNAWPGAANPSPMLGITVTGDFIIETKARQTESCPIAVAGLFAYSGLSVGDLSQWVAGKAGATYDQLIHDVTGESCWWSPSLTYNDNWMWFRLIRTGDAFTSFYSVDGYIWYFLRSYTGPLPNSILVGISVRNPLGSGGDYHPRFDYFLLL